MIKKNKLLDFINPIPILLLVYLALQIYRINYNVIFWIKNNNNNLLEIFLGIFREICDILYIPLWGFVIYFSILFCEHWIKDKK